MNTDSDIETQTGFLFYGKVALVTGAGAGIGLAAAKAFVEAGASVVLADRDAEAIGKATEELRSAGHTAIGVTCDVTDKAQVAAMVEQAILLTDEKIYERAISADSSARRSPLR